MLTSRIIRQVSRASIAYRPIPLVAHRTPLYPVGMRYFSKDESNFDAHSDFEPKTKATGDDLTA